MQVLDIAAAGLYDTVARARDRRERQGLGTGAEPGAALTKRLADQPQANIAVVKRPFDDPVPDDAPKLDLVTIVNNYTTFRTFRSTARR